MYHSFWIKLYEQLGFEKSGVAFAHRVRLAFESQDHEKRIRFGDERALDKICSGVGGAASRDRLAFFSASLLDRLPRSGRLGRVRTSPLLAYLAPWGWG